MQDKEYTEAAESTKVEFGPEYVGRWQAETFFKVMVAKKFTPQEISDTLQHMGQLFIAHAEKTVNDLKNMETQ